MKREIAERPGDGKRKAGGKRRDVAEARRERKLEAPIEKKPKHDRRIARPDENDFLREHYGSAEREARHEQPGASSRLTGYGASRAEQRQPHRQKKERRGGDTGPDLEALREKKRRVIEKQGRDETGSRVVPGSSEKERETQARRRGEPHEVQSHNVNPSASAGSRSTS